MKKYLFALFVVAIILLGTQQVVRSHCQIPCGIYGDTLRISMLYEDISTLEKSMNEIVKISKDNPPSWNQLVRFVTNKDEHAGKIHETVTHYFMTQRIKPAEGNDAAGREKYIAQLTALHQMLIAAMKAKQTTDLAHIEHLRKLVDQFARAYFSEADLKHIKEHHPEGK